MTDWVRDMFSPFKRTLHSKFLLSSNCLIMFQKKSGFDGFNFTVIRVASYFDSISKSWLSRWTRRIRKMSKISRTRWACRIRCMRQGMSGKRGGQLQIRLSTESANGLRTALDTSCPFFYIKETRVLVLDIFIAKREIKQGSGIKGEHESKGRWLWE